MIVLWNTQVGGWMTPGGSYSNRIADAKRFSQDEAKAIVRRHYNEFMGEYGLVPVREEDLD